MRNWAFYLPFCYTLFIRFSKVSQFISWVAIYIIPTLLVFLSFYEKGMFSFLLCYFLSVMLVYNYYEIGYIQNDTETIKKENNPTLRLTMIQLQYYKSHFVLIYSSRMFWGILLSLLLYLLSDFVSYFLCSSILLLLLYQVYNNVRNRFTLFLHFLLVIIRYWAIILYFPISLSFMCYLLLLFPVLNLLERSSESRFHIPYISYLIANRNDIPLFRVKYYLTLLFLMLILEIFTKIPLVILFLSFYFFSYRIIVCFFMKKKIIKHIDYSK